MAGHGGIVRPYGSTFLQFADYMRGAVRLSALMGLEDAWVYTHDSVGLGEDGPTHQPVEHYAALRAIPNLWFIRPGDANETSVAWRLAAERRGGPVALALTRQNLPPIDRDTHAKADGLHRGAYVLADAGAGALQPGGTGAPPELVLIASGSEVWVALGARERLEADGIPTRVVSMPCWELFEEQDQAYRDEVLPPEVRARLSVEAGATFGWARWVGEDGESLGIDHYGASAKGELVLEKFGFTADNVASRARALRDRLRGPRGRRWPAAAAPAGLRSDEGAAGDEGATREAGAQGGGGPPTFE